MRDRGQLEGLANITGYAIVLCIKFFVQLEVPEALLISVAVNLLVTSGSAKSGHLFTKSCNRMLR